MAADELRQKSPYAGNCIIVATKHAKSIAIAPPFLEELGASIIEYVVDTDMLGTFSGEIERHGSALECARKKCEWSLNVLGNEVEFAIASEGSFRPHPFIPFLPCDHEILYFIDRKRDFHLHVSHLSENTNYKTQKIKSLDELYNFAGQANFPSHAIIIRPNSKQTLSPIFKGLANWQALEAAFIECIKYSREHAAWIETDMRAHLNPSRMNEIQNLAKKLATRLKTLCPSCNSPGWGKTTDNKGLICSCCGMATEQIKSEVFGCVKCAYTETRNIRDEINEADPANCLFCNP